MENEFENPMPEYSQNRYTPSTPPEKKSHIGGTVVAIAIVCSLVGGAVGAAGVYFTRNLWSQTQTGDNSAEASQAQQAQILEGVRDNAVIETYPVDTGKEMTPAQVYAANVASTVGITTSVTTNYWGYPTTSAASGSGFIFSKDGYILTNYHVVEGSGAISVKLYSGESYDAELIGFDESNDIAILKIGAQDLSPVILGNSDNMNVGDPVVAIGNPLGELTFSLSYGVVSALDRDITLSGGLAMNLIQTDCAINSGNSGGALFNLYGEVIGITNAKYSGSSSSGASIDNIGFAIPINHIRGIVESIIEKGFIEKPYIGVSVVNVSQETQSYGLPQGAAVREIVKDSPAQEAGLQVNDIITSIDGTEISSTNDLKSVIAAAQVGQKLKLQVFRQGKTVSVTLTVGRQILSASGESAPQR